VDGGGAVQTKQQILKAIDDLPDDAGVEHALDRLHLLYKVQRGLRQADRGELISQQEVRQRMAKWLK
jgi:predicted transcriptional regulator